MESLAKACSRDRISQLPDEIIHHILSKACFTMEDIIETCVISKRWTNLWSSMPHLSFNYETWCNRFETREQNDAEFAHFVSTSLFLRDRSDVQAFFLKWCVVTALYEHRWKQITTWMKYAVQHNVNRLDIHVFYISLPPGEHHPPHIELYDLPPCIFTCQSLECLKLDMSLPGIRLDLPDVVRLGRLTKLRLDFAFVSSISLTAVMSGCPVLYNLKFLQCRLEDPDFSSMSLKKMYINECTISGTRIRISAPKLELLTFHHNDIKRLEVLLENLSSLAEATIQPGDYEAFFLCSPDEPLRLIFPMIKGLSKKELSEHQMFHSLRELELDGQRMVANIPVIIHFLQRSPNLEVLSLKTNDSFRGWEESFCCHHFNIYVTVLCGEEDDEIFDLLTDFFNRRCGCFQERMHPSEPPKSSSVCLHAERIDDKEREHTSSETRSFCKRPLTRHWLRKDEMRRRLRKDEMLLSLFDDW